MALFSLENLLKYHSWSAVSCVCKLPEYYFSQINCASGTTDIRHPCAILSNILTASQKESLHMLNGDLV